MHLTNENGLRIAHVETEEALSTDWYHAQIGADLVRVSEPEAAKFASLEKLGFAVKPSWITWLAPVCDSEEDFLARMSKRSRRSARRGMEIVREGGVRLSVRAPLDAGELDEFLVLYEIHMSRLRNGVPFARRIRDQLLR